MSVLLRNLQPENGRLVDVSTGTVYPTTSRQVLTVVDPFRIIHIRSVEWFWLYTKMHFPDFVRVHDVDFVRIDCFRKHIPFRAKFRKRIYLNATYCLIPAFPKYGISCTGECVNYKTGRKLTPRLNNYGYLVVSVWDPLTEEYRDVGVHTLIANAWILKNQDSEHTLVNHIDSNKQHNTVDNLEWTDHKENITHAVKSGVKGLAVPCIITDAQTQNTYKFTTLSEASAFLDVDPSLLKGHRFRKLGGLIHQRYKVEFERPHGVYSNLKERLTPIQIRYQDGTIVEVPSLRKAHKRTGICRATLSRLVKSQGKYSLHGVSLRYKCEDNWETPQEISQAKRIRIRDIVHNKETIASSLKDAADYMHIRVCTVKRMLRGLCVNSQYEISVVD